MSSTIYALAIDGFARTVHPTTREPYTLASALDDATGCGNAMVVRSENGSPWKVIVRDAGRNPITHEPTGRKIYRRWTRWAAARQQWQAWVWANERHHGRIDRLAVDGPDEDVTFASVRELARAR